MPTLHRYLAVFCFALIANSIAAYILLNFTSVDTLPDYYHVIAENLLTGNGYVIGDSADPLAWRPPVYPLFLAGLYSLFGTEHLPVIVAQILLNSLNVLLSLHLVREILTDKTAVYTAFIYALYPFSIYYVVRAMPAILFTFLLLVFLHTFYRFFLKPTCRNALVFGGMQGVLTMCKLFFQGFPVFFLVYMLLLWLIRIVHQEPLEKSHNGENNPGLFVTMWENFIARVHQFRPNPMLMFSILFGFALVVSPWILRNYWVIGEFPVIGTAGGTTFWKGNHLPTDGRDHDELEREDARRLDEDMRRIIGDDLPTNYTSDKKLYRAAIEDLLEHPFQTFWLMIRKGGRLWFEVYSPSMRPYQHIVMFLQLIIVVPAVFGIILAIREGRVVAPLFLLLVYFQIIFMMFMGTIRYILPMMPLVIAYAVYWFTERGVPRITERSIRSN